MRRLPRFTKSGVFAILMCLSAVLLVLPSSLTDWMRGILQPLAPLQWLLGGGARDIRSAASQLADPPPQPDDARRLRRENDELRRLLGHQQQMLEQLQQELAEATGIRDQLRDERAKIIFATVLAGAASPRRDALSISKGALAGVKVNDWVAAGVPKEQQDPADTGRDLMLKQWLIGRVVQVQPYVSVVRLCSDPEFGPLRVWAARRLPDGVWQMAEREALLSGAGNGRMEIRAASTDYFAAGYRLVLAPVGASSVALCLGQITAARTVPESALHFNMDVRPLDDPRSLSHVYVLSLGP